MDGPVDGTSGGPDPLRVLVAGGGSAGWMAAATLDAALNREGARAVAITVVESPDTPRIGVGEATIPTLRRTLRRLRIPEAEFLAATDATFKQAIVFADWSGPGSGFAHPFHTRPGDAGEQAAARFLRSDGRTPFADLTTPQPALAAAFRGPRRAADPDYAGPLPYAYHMDAEAFAELLAARAVARGVARVSAHLLAPERAPDQPLAAVQARDGRSFAADLFVDATGFRRLLIGQGGFVDQSRHLICDAAVALRAPCAPGPTRPFTVAAAREAGWTWDIPLRARRGRGYVHASAHLAPEAAEAALRAETPQAGEARRLRFQVGRLSRPWQANVAAVGLAAGFVEPLESTGLHLADLAAGLLAENAPLAGPNPGLARAYNALLTAAHDEVVDFVNLHYAASPRRDTPFWRDAADPARRTDRVAHLLELWEARPPVAADFPNALQAFNHRNWEFILHGLGWRPQALGPASGPPLAPDAELAAEVRRLAAELPGHDALLAALAPR